jgi:hypothetical protein
MSENQTSENKTNGNKIIGIKGMGRKSYITVSGMGFIAASQGQKIAVVSILIGMLVGMALQFVLDLKDKDEEK